MLSRALPGRSGAARARMPNGLRSRTSAVRVLLRASAQRRSLAPAAASPLHVGSCIVQRLFESDRLVGALIAETSCIRTNSNHLAGL
jgi:hypothetical protein